MSDPKAYAHQYDRAANCEPIPFIGTTSLTDQAADGGWNESDEPVGGEPADVAVAGTGNG